MAEYRPGALAATAKKKEKPGYKPGALAIAASEPQPATERESLNERFGLPREMFDTRAMQGFLEKVNSAKNVILQNMFHNLNPRNEPKYPTEGVKEAFTKKEPTPLQLMKPEGGKAKRTAAFLVNKGTEMLTDPVNLVTSPLIEKSVGAVKAGVQALIQTQKAQKQVAKVQTIVSPLVKPLSDNANIHRVLGAFGIGRQPRMFKELTQQYKADLEGQFQKVRDVLFNLDQETVRAQKSLPIYAKLIRDTARSRGGENPIIPLVRDAVKARSKGGPSSLKAIQEANENIAIRARAFGFNPDVIFKASDDILNHIKETDYLLLKAGGTTHQRVSKPTLQYKPSRTETPEELKGYLKQKPIHAPEPRNAAPETLKPNLTPYGKIEETSFLNKKPLDAPSPRVNPDELPTIDQPLLKYRESGTKRPEVPGSSRFGTKGIDSPSFQKHEVNVDDWLDQMFGKYQPTSKLEALGLKAEKPTPQIKLIYEAGVRNLVNDLPKFGEFVRPVLPDTPPNPGWIQVPEGGLLHSLAGYEMPASLYNMLQVEVAKAAKIPANQLKSEYIIAFDVLQWLQKNVIGTFKKGMIGNPATQAANVVANHQMLNRMLKQAKVNKSAKEVKDAVLYGFKAATTKRKANVLSPEHQAVMRHSPTLLQTQLDASIAQPQGAYGQVRNIRFLGNKPVEIPTVGKALGTLNYTNALADFQGLAEEAYKIAAIRLTKDVIGEKAAVAFTERNLFDYSNRGVVLEIFDRFGLWPFSYYPTAALKELMKAIAENPGELYKLRRYKELAQRGYDQGGIEQQPERYKSPFTFSIGGGDSLDLQRFHPFGGGIEGLEKLGQGDLFGAATTAVGMGRGGNTPEEQLLNASVYGRAVKIAAGLSPFSEGEAVKPLLAEGQPPDELGSYFSGLRGREIAKNYLPPFFPGGRAFTGIQEARQGISSSDSMFQEPRTMEQALLQYGLGLRIVPALTEKEKMAKLDPLIEKRIDAAGPVMDEELEKAERKITNPYIKEVGKLTPGQAKSAYKKAQQYLTGLLMKSGRVVNDKGEVTPEGRRRIRNAALRLVALERRADEEE